MSSAFAPARMLARLNDVVGQVGLANGKAGLAMSLGQVPFGTDGEARGLLQVAYTKINGKCLKGP